MFSYLCRKRPQRLQKGRRRSINKKYNRVLGRGLRHETLEDRHMLTLLGVEPLAQPIIAYDSGGSVTYDSTTDAFSVAATPLSIDSGAGSGLFFIGDLNINIEVDDTGALIGGTSGDDLVITGDVDLDGDFIIDESGVLLTGEILAFGSEDSGGTTDLYDYRFQITGGLLTTNATIGADYAGKDLGVTTTSEVSDFAGDFTVDFSGNAKGDVGVIEPEVEEGPPHISFNSGGSVAYDSTTDLWEMNATPLSIGAETNPEGLFFSGDVSLSAIVDDTGTLVSGIAGDDFVLTGDVDLDGDFIVDFSGTLLTGEIYQLTSNDSGGTTDDYMAMTTVTGGLLSGLYAGQDLKFLITSENSDFAGDFTVDFGGNAKGDIWPVDPPPPANPGIDIEKLTNGVDADTLPEAVEIDAGDLVVFTYEVTNTGDVPFAFADVVIVDDNGTPGDASDDVSTTSGDITLLAASDLGGDLILSPGETWQYEYATVALDLQTLGAPVVVDFEGFSAGTIIDDELSSLGLTVTSQDQVNHPAMIFDTANPTGGDTDLATPGSGVGNDTPLGNVLIISEDADQSDPDDDAAGGTLTFSWDDPVTIDTVTLLDIDSNEAGGSVALFFDQSGGLISSVPIPTLGNGSVQTLDINVEGVAEMQVNLVSSGAVAELVFREDEAGFYKNTAVVTVPDATDMDMSHYVNPETPGGGGDAPHISFDSGGSITYDATTDLFSMSATPLSIGDEVNPAGLFFSGDVLLDFVVDDTGTFVSGVGGDDFVLVGDVDLDGDFVVDFSGVLLTGEVFEFSSNDSGGSTDDYMVKSTVTGGLLSHLYDGQDLKFLITSESSTFAGDFTVDFSGNAKGDIWPVDPVVDVLASIGNYVFIDKDHNGLQNTGDLGVNGVTVNLLNEEGILIASTVTGFDGNGNAGFYLFYNLQGGNYIVEFEVPDGVVFTTMDAGDDDRDSDANVDTGQTDVITLADGEHRRDIDAGVKATVEVEKMVYKVEDFYTRHQKKKAGKIKSVDLEYNEAHDELSVSIDFKEYRGRLTDGFTFVVTPGEWPAGTEDKYAMFYFDADVYGRHGGPVLTVYGYNGKYDGQSYRSSDSNSHTTDPDQIATSKDNSSGWVKELDVHTYRSHGRWHRTMSFRIDASVVNSHVPLQGGDWEGAGFGNMASFSIDTFDRLYTKYNSDGYLKKWYACFHGWLDADWVHTTCDTVVVDKPIEEFFDDFGWEVTEYQDGISDGDPPQDSNDTDSDLDWEGSVDAALEEAFA